MDNNKTISAKKIVPLIVMFMLISTIIIALIVGNGINHVSEELAKNSEVEQNNENILAEETVADHEHNLVDEHDETSHWKRCNYEGCNYTTEKQEHTFTIDWPMGESCSPSNIGTRRCEDCGYTDPENKITREHLGLTFRTFPDYYHSQYCSSCNTILSKEDCTDENGNRITCTNLQNVIMFFQVKSILVGYLQIVVLSI